MIGTKEADLVTAVLLYAMRCLAEGDQYALRGMRFGPKEIEALRDLNLSDLYRVGALQAHCLDIRLNRDVFWPMLAHLQGTREDEELQRDLIQADAPLEMMRRFFGVGAREYTRLRRMLALDPVIGRPAEPDEATAHAIWHAITARLKSDPERPLDARDYLDIHGQCGASVRAIWHIGERWENGEDVDGIDGAQAGATTTGAATDAARARPALE